MNTLETSLELPVTVEYDCLDEEAIEITSIKFTYYNFLDEGGKGTALKLNMDIISQIQYDSLIDQINADLESQKQEAADFKKECERDDKIHDPDW